MLENSNTKLDDVSKQSFEENEVSSYRSRTKLSNKKASDDELYEEYEDETDDQD